LPASRLWPPLCTLPGLLSACSGTGTDPVPSTRSPPGTSPLMVERLGGLAGYGGSGARLRSRGEIAIESLAAIDRHKVESLFAAASGPAPRASDTPLRDGFRYRVSRYSPGGTETIEVPEEALPAAVAGCVKDELL
jgi:hypothetical protein